MPGKRKAHADGAAVPSATKRPRDDASASLSVKVEASATLSSSSSSSSSSSLAPQATETDDQLKERFLKYLEGRPGHKATNAEVSRDIGQSQRLSKIINQIIETCRISLHVEGNMLAYELRTQEYAESHRGLNTKDNMILEHIRKSGNSGIWSRDLKHKTGIQNNTDLQKILNKLMGRKLVKVVKSITNKTRKLYMLYGTKPSREISGGPWYTDNEFDGGFIDALRTTVRRYLNSHPCVSLQEMHSVIMKVLQKQVEFTIEHTRELLNTLIFDNLVTPCKQVGKKLMPVPLDLHASLSDSSVLFTAASQFRISWTNDFDQVLAADSDYSDAFGRGMLAPYCSCGCGQLSGCGIAWPSTDVYLERLWEREQEEARRARQQEAAGDDVKPEEAGVMLTTAS